MVYLLFYQTLSRILCNFRGKIPIKSFELPTDINQLDVLGEMGFSCFSALMRTINCRIRDIKPYQLVFAPKTENMWRIIYYPGHQHDWNRRRISEKISVRFRCGVATG